MASPQLKDISSELRDAIPHLLSSQKSATNQVHIPTLADLLLRSRREDADKQSAQTSLVRRGQQQQRSLPGSHPSPSPSSRYVLQHRTARTRSVPARAPAPASAHCARHIASRPGAQQRALSTPSTTRRVLPVHLVAASTQLAAGVPHVRAALAASHVSVRLATLAARPTLSFPPRQTSAPRPHIGQLNLSVGSAINAVRDGQPAGRMPSVTVLASALRRCASQQGPPLSNATPARFGPERQPGPHRGTALRYIWTRTAPVAVPQAPCAGTACCTCGIYMDVRCVRRPAADVVYREPASSVRPP
ncbi:hypothetical protein CERSUDRAFT_93482 [Gelatoporia subvermispora B]|uniref:Uncharacterized protein n=1 Tax=Ceriporiopsis subvermispora (strain B) TaxID=914234 RepID=M2RGP1_CERS8|nr:hypothetical protein CERSUDRAFT_93482 [Gelatoporia subvermispora B]